MADIEATLEERLKFSRLAVDVCQLFHDHGLKRSEGMDVLAVVVVCMLRALKTPPEQAHNIADELARCIKINYDMQERNYEPIN
jgi:hypothetical protein